MTRSAEIFTDANVARAAEILQTATPYEPIDLVIGNGFFDVCLPDYIDYKRIHGGTSRDERLKERYWHDIEIAPIETANLLPGLNYVCLSRLLRMQIVKNIVTTNYDQYISSVFDRMPELGGWQLNPCHHREGSGETATWDGDGYRTVKEADTTPVWKIHGDLAFVRCYPCGHVLRLPRFIVGKFMTSSYAKELLNKHSFESLHHGLIHPERIPDPSLLRDHEVEGYRHHVDYGSDRSLFERERDAAIAALRETPKAAVLVIGLTMKPRNLEDLVEPLVTVAKKTPLVYMISSEYPLRPGENELIDRLEEEGCKFTVINEVHKDGLLLQSLVELLGQLGETGLRAERERWRKTGKWWDDE